MERTNTTTGISFGGLLTIVFIVLKLCGVIAWSWWWVLCPLWGPLALGLAFILGGSLWAVVMSLRK